MSVPTTDPGLMGVVPFTFECHRGGHCCSGGSGHVWVDETELEGLAASVDDVKTAALPALRHRVLLNFEGEAEGVSSDEVIEGILKGLPESEV